MKPYLQEFTTILDRNNGSVETTEEIRVTYRVQSYADAVGFGSERCRRRVVEITDTCHDGLPLSEEEIATLHERALEQLTIWS